MEYLATFHTHYGSIAFNKFCRKNHITARMLPIPRELSSSCGTCVRFTAQRPPVISDHEDMECCYIVEATGSYTPTEDIQADNKR